MALFLHCVASLSNNGKAAIIVQPGILYRGGMEEKIRRSIVEQDIIETVITLPSQLTRDKLFSHPSLLLTRINQKFIKKR
jgi:type I restriction-modification system DNA methylase subunit